MNIKQAIEDFFAKSEPNANSNVFLSEVVLTSVSSLGSYHLMITSPDFHHLNCFLLRILQDFMDLHRMSCLATRYCMDKTYHILNILTRTFLIAYDLSAYSTPQQKKSSPVYARLEWTLSMEEIPPPKTSRLLKRKAQLNMNRFSLQRITRLLFINYPTFL